MGLVFGGLSALGAYQMSNDPMNTNLLMGERETRRHCASCQPTSASLVVSLGLCVGFVWHFARHRLWSCEHEHID